MSCAVGGVAPKVGNLHLGWPSVLLPTKVCCCCWLVVTLSLLPSRTGTGSTGHMFTYSSSPKCWRTGRTLSILVSLVLAALTEGNKSQVSSASPSSLCEKLQWCVLVVAWEKNGGEIAVFVTSVAQEKPSKCPAASAAILCLILALEGTKQRAWRAVLSDTRGNRCGQCGLIIPCLLWNLCLKIGFPNGNEPVVATRFVMALQQMEHDSPQALYGKGKDWELPTGN